MKKKLLFLAVFVISMVCLFAITSNAATGTFGDSDTAANVTVGTVIKDTTSQIVMMDDKIYPTYYFLEDRADFTWNFTRVKDQNGNEYTVSSVKKIEIPEGITELDNSDLKGDTKNIVYVSLPSTFASLTGWGGQFQLGSKLETVIFDKSCPLTTIPKDCFHSAENLKTLVLPDNLTTISSGAFRGCTSLTELVFPNTVTSVDKSAVYNCKSITKLVLGASCTYLGLSDSFAYMGNQNHLTIVLSPSVFDSYETFPDRAYSWDNNHMKNVTYYFTFSKNDTPETALAKVTALKTKFSNYVNIENATLMPYDESKPIGDSSYVISGANVFVYGVNPCDAYYNGNHTPDKDDFNCTTGMTCANCGGEEAGKEHKTETIWTYPNGYTNVGSKLCKCVNEDTCKVNGASNVPLETPAIITPLGYSVKIDVKHGYGISADYEINEIIVSYNDYLGEGNELEIGFLAANSTTFADSNIMVNGELNSQKGLKVEVDEKYRTVRCILSGFTAEVANNLSLVMAFYVIDAEGTSYIQSADVGNNYKNLDETFSADERLDIVTIAKVAEVTNTDISKIPTA